MENESCLPGVCLEKKIGFLEKRRSFDYINYKNVMKNDKIFFSRSNQGARI